MKSPHFTTKEVHPGDDFAIRREGMRVYIPGEATEKGYVKGTEVNVDDVPCSRGSFDRIYSSDRCTVAFWFDIDDIDKLIAILSETKRALSGLWAEQQAMMDTFRPTPDVD